MGRPRITDNDDFIDLKNVLENSARKIQSEKLRAKIHLENLAAELDLQNAMAIVTAKQWGLSDHAIGVASGRTSHKARKALIEWAYKTVEEHKTKGADNGPTEN